MRTSRIRRSQNNSIRRIRNNTSAKQPVLDFAKMTPAQQEEFKKALAQSPEFKKALAEKAKSDPKLKAAIVEGMRKQAAAAPATPAPAAPLATPAPAAALATPAPAAAPATPAPAAALATPAPASAAVPPPTFSSSFFSSKGWNLSGQPVVVSPRDAMIAKARANAAAASRAEQVAKQQAAQEAAAKAEAAKPAVFPLFFGQYDITQEMKRQIDDAIPEQAATDIFYLARLYGAAEANPEASVNEVLQSVGPPKPWSEYTKEDRTAYAKDLKARADATRAAQRKQIEVWKAESRELFGPMGHIIVDKRPERFDSDVRNFIKERLGVPGTHAVRLRGKKTRIFTFVNDDQGKLVHFNTDTKGPGMLKQLGQVVGTVLSVVPTPVQPFAAAAMAIDGADQAIKDGDTLGAVVNVAAAVTVGSGYASGAASAAGNTAQAANLATVANTAQNIGTAAQVVQAVENKDALALLNAAGNVAVDLNLGDPTKAITAVNLIHGAEQGDMAGVLRTAANYARANGNYESANILSGASVALGTIEGIKDDDWNKVALHLGLGLSDIQRERVRNELELEPTRPDANIDVPDGLEPIHVDVEQRPLPTPNDDSLGSPVPSDDLPLEEVIVTGTRPDPNLVDPEPTRSDTNLENQPTLEPIVVNVEQRDGPGVPNGPSPSSHGHIDPAMAGMTRVGVPRGTNVRAMSNDELLKHTQSLANRQGVAEVFDVSPGPGLRYFQGGAEGPLWEDALNAASIPAAYFTPVPAAFTGAINTGLQDNLDKAQAEIARRVESGRLSADSLPEIRDNYGPVVGAIVTTVGIVRGSPAVARYVIDKLRKGELPKNGVPDELKSAVAGLSEFEAAKVRRLFSDTPAGARMRRDAAIQASDANIANAEAALRARVEAWEPPKGKLGDQLAEYETSVDRARDAVKDLDGYDPDRALQTIDIPSGRTSSRIASSDEVLAPIWTPKGMTQVQAVFDGESFRVQVGNKIELLSPREFAQELRKNPALENNPNPILLRTVADTGFDFAPDGGITIPSGRPLTVREADQIAAVLQRPVVRNTGPHVDADLDGNLNVGDYAREPTGGWTVHVPDRVNASTPIRGGGPSVVRFPPRPRR